MKLAFADRLTPQCGQSRRSSLDTSSSSEDVSPKRRPRRPSCTQSRARAIVKKYRRHVRETEFRRLRAIVPAVAEDEKASQAQVLEETIQYIEDLHAKLLQRIQSTGLPTALRDRLPSSSPAPLLWTPTDLKAVMQSAFADEMDARLRQKRRSDSLRLRQILQASSLHEASARLPTSARIE